MNTGLTTAVFLVMLSFIFLLSQVDSPPPPPPVQPVDCKLVQVPTRIDWYVGDKLVARLECKNHGT